MVYSLFIFQFFIFFRMENKSSSSKEEEITKETNNSSGGKNKSMTSSKEHSKPFILMCLIANIILSISIVLVNKTVYQIYHFPNITLTCLHFVFTSVGMMVCQYFGMFTVKKLPLTKMVPIALTFCGFVVFTNLSLQFNTVGTYQIIKSMTTPCIIVIQTYYYSRHFSTKVKLTLVSYKLQLIQKVVLICFI